MAQQAKNNNIILESFFGRINLVTLMQQKPVILKNPATDKFVYPFW